jgi:hypothetical protein
VSTVRIPPVLRASAGGNEQVEVTRSTVGEVIVALVARYPVLGTQLLTPEGGVNWW